MDSEKAISPSKGPTEASIQQSPLGLNGNDNCVGGGGGGVGGGGGNGGSQETSNSATNEW